MPNITRILVVCCLLVPGALLGCGGSDDGVGEGTMPEGSRGDEAVRAQCTGETRALDVNNDGRPDIRHNYDGSTRRCSEFDMNFDGAVDITRFYAGDGQTPVREEHDFDFDGRIDQISYYEGGQLVRKELDTNFDNRIDTWMWCEGGLVARAERDRRNTGEADTWEEYENGLLSVARYDDNNDGDPEKWEVFQNGQLVEVRFDTDSDGRPDRAEEIPADAAGPPDERISCTGQELADQEERAGTRGGSEPQEGTTGTTDDEPSASEEAAQDTIEETVDTNVVDEDSE